MNRDQNAFKIPTSLTALYPIIILPPPKIGVLGSRGTPVIKLARNRSWKTIGTSILAASLFGEIDESPQKEVYSYFSFQDGRSPAYLLRFFPL
jgi:hypothetical protein